MKTIAELTDEDFDQAIAGATGPVVVEFYAPWREVSKWRFALG